ncbi:MAG: NYN domain-containing protein [Pseudomonadales bacterium]
MLERQPRIALLIDADNSPASKIDVILAELAKVGVTNIRRAYGNWKKQSLKGWEAVLHEYAIRPVQQFDYSKGKNATDMQMVIEAMELLYNDAPDAYGIISSDSDFTPLVMHLKAKGAQVFGFGAKRTPMPFVAACSRFLYLENLGEPGVDEAPASKAPRRRRKSGGGDSQAADSTDVADVAEAAPRKLDAATLRQDARLVSLLRNAVESAMGDDGWSSLGAVAQRIGNQASFDSRNYGYRKLIDLIEATQLFDMERRGTNYALRDKRTVKVAPN